MELLGLYSAGDHEGHPAVLGVVVSRVRPSIMMFIGCGGIERRDCTMLEKLKQAWESGHRCDSFAEHQGAREAERMETEARRTGSRKGQSLDTVWGMSLGR